MNNLHDMMFKFHSQPNRTCISLIGFEFFGGLIIQKLPIIGFSKQLYRFTEKNIRIIKINIKIWLQIKQNKNRQCIIYNLVVQMSQNKMIKTNITGNSSKQLYKSLSNRI